MDYTISLNSVVHPGTGHRMHDLSGAFPTVVSDKDLNSLIWSLMAVLNAAGIEGVQFDPAEPNSYNRLLAALNKLFMGAKTNTWNRDSEGNDRFYFELVDGAAAATYVRGYSPSGGPIFSVWTPGAGNRLLVFSNGTVRAAADAVDQMDLTTLRQVQGMVGNAMPIGFPGYWPGNTPPPGWIKRNGALLPRSGAGSYPLLTDLVVSGAVKVVSEAAWPSNPGAFTLGDGATTIRIPDGRGLIEKGYHDGSGTYTTDTARALGSYEADGNKAHSHTTPTQAGTNGGANIAQTDRTGNSWNAPTSTEGNAEATVRNAAYMPIIRAYNP